MNRHTIFASYKILLSALIAGAVITQIAGLVSAKVFNAGNFFSFFTIESNIFIAVIFALSAFGHYTGTHVKGITLLRGAAALYMVTTGLVYVTLLSGLQESLNTHISWVNFVLHYFIPVIALLDWLLDRPNKEKIGNQHVWLWLVFPIVWLVYSVIRGASVGWYPYPFLNPNTGGGLYEVVVVCVVISVLMAVLGVALVWLGKLNPIKKLKKILG